jgi:hypothetical protein
MIKKKIDPNQKEQVKQLLNKIKDRPKNVGGYSCGSCSMWYAEEDEARECCARADPCDGYECPECQDMYETESEALDCCSER